MRPFTALSLMLISTLGIAQEPLIWRGDLPTTRAVFNDVAALYAAKKGVTFTAEMSSTQAAFAAAAAGEVDLMGSARPAAVTSVAEQSVQSVPVAWDALAVVVHSSNPARAISVRQLREILTGRVTNFEAIGGNSGTIRVHALDDQGDGIGPVIEQMLLRGQTLVAGRRFAKLDELEAAVAAEPLALAVTTYSGARQIQVKLLAVEGRPLTPESLASGEYLLYFPLYIGRSASSTRAREIRAFVSFLQETEAKRALRRNGLLPYTEGLRLVSQQMNRDEELARLLAAEL